MARRRVKKRTHVGARTAPANNTAATKLGERIPKSMVIRIGAADVGPSVSQLVKDMRHVMEPHTAVRLQERRNNKLRDYTTMAGPLGVSHLLLFSRSSSGNTNMRLALMPRGPTLSFRVEKYSLCKDVMKAQKHPKSGAQLEYLNPPLLVMNNFLSPVSPTDPKTTTSGIPKHLEQLTTDLFQNMFPAIFAQTTPLHSIKRVLLFNREPSPTTDAPTTTPSYVLTLRHYAITTKRTGIPKSIRRLTAAEKLISGESKRRKGLPSLGKLEDVADYILDPAAAGYTSASETEVETDAEVEVLAPTTRKVLSKRDKQRAAAARAQEDDGVSAATTTGKAPARTASGGGGGVEKRAVKLVELGPRMRLRLTKVEEGVCGGRVMWHEHIHKSAEEVRRLDEMWRVRNAERAERRRVQRENVERKRREREVGGGEKPGEGEEGDEEFDSDLEDDEWDEEREGEEADGLDEGVDEDSDVDEEMKDRDEG